MVSPVLFVAIVAACAIHTEGYSHTDRRVSSIDKTANADQMVQNILQWLEGVYAQNSRRIRQGTFREYLPPINTEHPRPFQPGYPPAGISPQPPFPFPTNPATGGVTAPEGYDDNLLPPEQGSGNGERHVPEDVSPTSDGSSTGEPTAPNHQPEQPITSGQVPSYTTSHPGYTTAQPGYTTGHPGYPTGGQPGYTTAQPGYTTGHPGYPAGGQPGYTTVQPGYTTGHPGYPTEGQPGFTTAQPGYTTGHPGYPTEGQPGSTTVQPGYTTGHPGYPTEGQPGSTTVQPGYTTVQPGYTTGHPGYPTGGQPGFTTAQPGYTTGHPGDTTVQPDHATGQPSYTTGHPEQPTNGPIYTTAGQPGLPTGAPTLPAEEQPGPFPTHPAAEVTTGVPDVTAPAQTEHAGYPEGTPSAPFTSGPEVVTSGPELAHPEGTLQPGQSVTDQPQSTTPEIVRTHGDAAGEDATHSPIEPSTPAAPETTIASEVPAHPSTTVIDVTGGTLVPSGFTTSPSSVPIETEKAPEGTPAVTESGVGTTTTTPSPETNTIPGLGGQEPSVVDEDDESKHPPHIHAIDVQCGKEMMTINIEFNREFNGIIYSKGHYDSPDCRYVQENSAQTKYTFTVSLDKCGTQFVNAIDTENQSYLENILVLQNEPGIQEVWDTVRSVRCLWEGHIRDTLSVAFSIGMLSQEIITFSGDTAMAKLDVVVGRSPFGEPANGLVKIGEEMTLVVSVSGDPGFDLQVKDCRAVDVDGNNAIALTDEDGCILKPKVFGAFQKTRDTGTSGASIVAYAYFNAFKFPDQMDLKIECNIELCKTDCDICSKDGQQLEPGKRRRRRREVADNSTGSGDWITMGKLMRVILPDDLSQKTALELTTKDHICMTIQGFVFTTAVLVSLLVISGFVSVCLWLRRREKIY